MAGRPTKIGKNFLLKLTGVASINAMKNKKDFQPVESQEILATNSFSRKRKGPSVFTFVNGERRNLIKLASTI